jgi:SAM-dependent methyltransferase
VDSAEWDARYAKAELEWGAEPNRFLVEEVEGLEPGRALDVAAGEGRNAVWLAERGWSVTAVDFSGVAVAKARRLAGERDVEVEWVTADVVRYVPAEGSFDLVIVFYLHLRARDMATVLRRAAGALRPGATLLVVGHDRANLAHGVGGPQDPAILLDAHEVATELDGLEVKKAERVRRPVAGAERDALDTLVRAVRPRT